MDVPNIPQVPLPLLVPSMLGLTLLAMLLGIIYFFKRQTERLKTYEAHRMSLPEREREFRDELIGEIRSLRDRLTQAEKDEAECHRRLRRVEHKLANAEQIIMVLQRKAGVPITDPIELEKDPDPLDRELVEDKKRRVRRIRRENNED